MGAVKGGVLWELLRHTAKFTLHVFRAVDRMQRLFAPCATRLKNPEPRAVFLIMQLRFAAGSNDVDFGDVLIEFPLALCFCNARSCNKNPRA